MRRASVLGVLTILWSAGCVSESSYKQEVAKADALSAQNATYEKLNAQLQAEVKGDQATAQGEGSQRP